MALIKNLLSTNSFETILVNKAHGSWIWDTKGKKYLDCTSGMWCCNLGHNHPRIVQAIKKQVEELIHRNNRFLTPITLEAAKKVLDFLPDKFDKITFLNSGSEAMEFAINFAKKVTKREKVISLQDSYLGAYGSSRMLSYNSSKANEFKIPYQECKKIECDCIERLEPNINQILADRTNLPACLVLEPVMVSGGIHKPCSSFIKYLCQRVQDVGGLVVIDEVTTGFGRLGKKVGYKLYNIKPDIIVLGKALGNGYPISAIATYSNLELEIPQEKRYYVQSHQLDPLGSAVAKTVVEIFEREQVIEKSKEKIKNLKTIFKNHQYEFIMEVRSYGMLFGIEIQSQNKNSTNNLILRLKDELLKEGVMVGVSLPKQLLRLIPPLNIGKDEIDYLESKITTVFQKLAN
ncbi:MAG: class-III pyridoxal-phosphate-dependent aminotransferase [Candidatus Heimdallarchaeaceae archaeon]